MCAGAGSGISVAGPDAAGLTCEHGTLKAGLTTITLERDGTNIVIHKVPADVCETRGEDYVDPVGAASLETVLHEAARSGCASKSGITKTTPALLRSRA